MDLLLYNDSWMAYNIFLAILPVIFAWLTVSRLRKTYRFIFGILWFLFLPNTIYILTDFIHLIEVWHKQSLLIKYFLVFQYAIFELAGMILYVFAFFPFEVLLVRNHLLKRKSDRNSIIVAANFVIGFGMVLGRIERINSWDVFTSTGKVLKAIQTIFSSPEQLSLFLLFGLFINLFYFLLRKQTIRKMGSLLRG